MRQKGTIMNLKNGFREKTHINNFPNVYEVNDS